MCQRCVECAREERERNRRCGAVTATPGAIAGSKAEWKSSKIVQLSVVETLRCYSTYGWDTDYCILIPIERTRKTARKIFNNRKTGDI